MGTPTQILTSGSLSKCMFTINIYKYKEREGGRGPTGWGYPNSFRVFTHTRHTRSSCRNNEFKTTPTPPTLHPSNHRIFIFNNLYNLGWVGGPQPINHDKRPINQIA